MVLRRPSSDVRATGAVCAVDSSSRDHSGVGADAKNASGRAADERTLQLTCSLAEESGAGPNDATIGLHVDTNNGNRLGFRGENPNVL